MTEIETIGISLVLDNGVAQGMQRLHRDLAMFDRAVGQRAADLRRLAQGHAAPLLPQQPAPATMTPKPILPRAVAPHPAVDNPTELTAPAERRARTAAATIPSAPVLVKHERAATPRDAHPAATAAAAAQSPPPAPPGRHPAPVQASPAPKTPATPATPAPAPRRATSPRPSPPMAPAVPPQVPVTAPPRPRIEVRLASAPPPAQPRPAAGVSPPVQNPAVRPARPAISLSTPVPKPEAGPGPVAPRRVLAPRDPPLVGALVPKQAPATKRAIPTPPRAARHAPAPTTPPPLRVPEAKAARSLPLPAPVAHLPQTPPIAHGGIPASDATSWQQSPAAPPLEMAAPSPLPPPSSPPLPQATAPAVEPLAQAVTTTPIQGDLLIDGAQIGRWLGETMGRAAARPPSAARRFNSRMMPAWPGMSL